MQGFHKLKYLDFSTTYSITGVFLKKLSGGAGGNLLEVLILRDCMHLKKAEVERFFSAVLAGDFKFLRHFAFAVIAASPLHLDLSCILEHVIAELTAFLRKANRAPRQATLETLNTLIVAYGDKIGSAAYEVIIVELSTLISDSDLHMAALALELCSTMMSDRRSTPNVSLTVRNKVLPQALTLVRSSLLQGQALLALQSLFTALVYSANTSFDALLDSLLSTAKPSSQSVSVAK